MELPWSDRGGAAGIDGNQLAITSCNKGGDALKLWCWFQQ
jgi:hypothetical protein